MFISVWKPVDRAKLIGLSTLWLGSVVLFWRYWLRPEHAGTAWGMPVISAIAAWPFIVMAFVVFFTLRMKRPAHTIEQGKLRTAMVVTKAPSEPLSVVKRTLLAALGQEYAHDTWVADEDPSAAALRWYREHGVKVSTRKGVDNYHNESWPRRKLCKEGNLAFFYDTYAYDRYDVVVQMDVDHIPQSGYLEKMVQPFADPKVGYVTAPSVCDLNYDRSWSARARAQADSLFQGPVQAGSNDGWVTKCIGSHYAVRTAALKKIGGLGPELAEDYTTTVMMNAKGFVGVAAFEAEAKGAGPHSFGDIVVQDYQWARSLASVLITFFPKYFRSLALKQKIQFTFTQLWYPVSALVWLGALVVPIIALLTGEAPVQVSFLEFAAFYSLPYLFALGIYMFVVSKGHTRPKKVKFVSWEMFLFELARWPWVIIAMLDMVLSTIRKKSHIFKVTAKRQTTANLPVFILFPYIAIVAISALAIIYRQDQGALQGYYWFTLAFASAYALLIALAAVLHIREMIRVNQSARTIGHIPHFITSLFLMVVIASSGFIGAVQVATASIEVNPFEYVPVHTVNRGDSLWSIAERLYGEGQEWIRFEPRERPNFIVPGDVVRAPALYHPK